MRRIASVGAHLKEEFTYVVITNITIAINADI